MNAHTDNRATWSALVAELDAWSRRGLTANFWVRDDDAIALTPELDRLTSLAQGAGIEIALAVIPACLTDPLIAFLKSGDAPFYPMCHGLRHRNYSGPQNPSEFGPGRPLSLMVDDAASAYEIFMQHFGAMPVVFVPPFMRIAAILIGELPKLGFRGVSIGPTTSERRAARLASRLGGLAPLWPQARARSGHYDVHIDPFDWGRSSARSAQSLEREVIGYLRIRRSGVVPSSRPIGLLTHHLAFDDQTWAVCRETLDVLTNHPAVEWPSVQAIVRSGFAYLQDGVAQQAPSQRTAPPIPNTDFRVVD